MTPAPPQRDDRERKLCQPDDRQPEHSEQHPRAQRAGRGLLREPHAVARVQRERREAHDEPEHPQDQQEALEPLRPGDELRAEHPVDVDVRQRQAVGHHRPPEQPGDAEPPGDECEADGEAERLHAGTTDSVSSGAGGWGARSAGEESG